MFFEDIPGNQGLKKELVTAAKKNRVCHAQVFSGNSGSAKLALAFAYARYLNCTGDSDNDSCGQCASCIKHNSLSHPDLHLVFPVVKTSPSTKAISDNLISLFRPFVLKNIYGSLNDWIETIEIKNKNIEKGTIYKDEAVSIQKKLRLKKFEAKYRIFIVWMPEQMNIEASNKLLKVFEEPPKKTIFLLASEQPERLLPTIASRLQNVSVKNFNHKEILTFFENKSLTPQQEQQLSLVEGSDLGKIIKQLENVEEVDLIGEFSQWMRLIYKMDVVNISKWVDSIYTTGRKHQKRVLEYSIKIIRECLIFNFGDHGLLRENRQEKDFISKFAPFVHEYNSVIIIEKLEKSIQALNRNANAKILFFELSLQIIKLLKVKRKFAIK